MAYSLHLSSILSSGVITTHCEWKITLEFDLCSKCYNNIYENYLVALMIICDMDNAFITGYDTFNGENNPKGFINDDVTSFA